MMSLEKLMEMEKSLKPETIESMTNDRYKEICETNLNHEIESIRRMYADSLKEAEKHYVV